MTLTPKERAKRYRKAHPNRLKESKKKYRESENGKQKEKKYQEEHKENRRGYVKKYITNHREKSNEWGRLSYHRNKHKHVEQSRQRNRERVKKIKHECMNHYCEGNIKCMLCGITDIEVLTIDHIYGGGNRLRKEGHERKGINFYHDLIKRGFPDGYRVLCFNCNHKESLRLKLRGKKASDEQINNYLKKERRVVG